MNRALKFRHRLTAAGICTLAILLFAFLAAFRNAEESARMNGWVVHTHEVLGTIGRVRLDRAWLENELWGYRETGDVAFQRRFLQDRDDLRESMKRLRELTADNPEQQRLLASLDPSVWHFVAKLEEEMAQSSKAKGSNAQVLRFGAESDSFGIREQFDELEKNELALLKTRSAAVGNGINQTRIVLVITGVLSFGILIVAGHLIQREVMTRADVENGLRQTQTLLRESSSALSVAEEKSRNQYAILKSVMESMAEGVIVADQEGRFTLFNPAAEQILGAGPAEIPPSEWSLHYRAYETDQTTLFPYEELPLVRALQGQPTDDVHIYIRRSEHSKFSCINASARPLLAADGSVNGGVVVFHDITAVLEANGELEAFNYSVSHDLRAPLRHMDGFSRILEEEFGLQLPPEARHYIGRIRKAATHMTDLVDDMLQLSRVGRQALKHQTVFLAEMAEEFSTEQAQEAAAREIEWRIGPIPAANGDPLLLRQVLANLLANAVKFTRTTPHAVIEVGGWEENGEVLIFVRDNGAGFDPRYADKLFGVFQRLHRQDEFEGTGIGLAIVQRIVHKHGGRVWAESQPGQGATFFFALPGQARLRVPVDEPVGANA